MTSDWQETTLGQISEKIQYGYTESASTDPIGPKFLRITDIQDDILNWDSVPYCKISSEDYDKYKLEPGDIVIARTGNSTGATALIKEKIDAVFASYLIRYRINRKIAEPTFVGMLLRSSGWESFVKSIKGGSAQAGANAKMLAEFPIFLPPLELQKQIANIFYSFDNKIALLRRQNETLEQMAQAVYRHWFVDFEFPDENGNPYKSSGGKFVPSELGDIPEGWEVGKLDDCISKIVDYRGKTPKKLGMDWSEIGIPAYSAKNIKNGTLVREETMNFGSEELYNLWMKDEINKGDILLTSEAPLGELFYLANPSKFILSQRLFVIRASDNDFSPYLYYYLNSSQGQLFIKKRATGSTVVGIRQSELREVEVLIPPKQVISDVSKIFLNVLLKRELNYKFTRNLAKTRDILLPRLMSGKIRVRL